jgi:hypothetical protein
MVKVKGPMMSLAASGTFGNQLTYSQTMRRPYVRRRIIPTNPRSGAQISTRAMLTFLSQAWSSIAPATQAQWTTLAAAAHIAPYHAYCQAGGRRWRSFLGPATIVAANPGFPVSGLDTWTATAGVRGITLNLSSDLSQVFDWGFLIFASTVNGFTPVFSNLIAAVPTDGANTVVVEYAPLVADTYYFDAKIFNAVGSLGALKGEINATVP